MVKCIETYFLQFNCDQLKVVVFTHQVGFFCQLTEITRSLGVRFSVQVHLREVQVAVADLGFGLQRP